MRCPKCYGKVSKQVNRCEECGFDLSTLKEKYSNKEVQIARKEYRHDDIIYTNIVPKDISKKKFIMLLIFLGFFGGHNFYVKKNARAIVMLVFSSILIVWSQFISGIFGFVLYNEYITLITSLLGASSLMLWIFDIVNVILSRYKYPVVEVQ